MHLDKRLEHGWVILCSEDKLETLQVFAVHVVFFAELLDDVVSLKHDTPCLDTVKTVNDAQDKEADKKACLCRVWGGKS